MPHAKITALNIYPVKSCRGIALESATLTPTGFTFDRRWMVVDERGKFLTQREAPTMSLIKAQLDGSQLRLGAPGMADLEVGDATPGAPRQVQIWGEQCDALDCGPAAAHWLSTFLDRPLRLVLFDPSHKRVCDKAWTGEVEATSQFADGFPLLVISEASLENLNTRLSEPLPMNRFRPNIVLSGLRAHDEDRIRELYTDSVRLRLVKPCERCSITTTDQATGQRLSVEPLRTLKSYRWDSKLRGVMFGQNGIVVRGVGSSLRVGQDLEIEWITA